MSLRDIARASGLSKDAVHRLVGPGGRDSLVAAHESAPLGTVSATA
ncbi:hypothetical protein RHCRD62_10394 [Rhodococcus sp. RD6.2]|nr:hypothetical protein [Rhodococcus sp. RD6.2]CRK49539.1 hypothetical protein RHCRD62_10394 [Rhodococcus sp. RD6.2]